MHDPPDAVLTEVEVTLYASPAGHGLVELEIFLAALAATLEPVFSCAIAQPIVFIFVDIFSFDLGALDFFFFTVHKLRHRALVDCWQI